MLLTDPIIVGDISGNGRLNAADASLLAQYAALIDVGQIPAIPAGGLAASGAAPSPLRLGIATRWPTEPTSNSSASADAPSIWPPNYLQHTAVDLAIIEWERPLTNAESQLSLEDAVDELFAGIFA